MTGVSASLPPSTERERRPLPPRRPLSAAQPDGRPGSPCCALSRGPPSPLRPHFDNVLFGAGGSLSLALSPRSPRFTSSLPPSSSGPPRTKSAGCVCVCVSVCGNESLDSITIPPPSLPSPSLRRPLCYLRVKRRAKRVEKAPTGAKKTLGSKNRCNSSFLQFSCL